jgi:GGDEF-like domain/PucR C-terminal helix-turn-helix domain
MSARGGPLRRSAPRPLAPGAAPSELRALYLAMLDAVLTGSGLSAVAALAADACGGPVAILAPELDLVAGSPGTSGALGRLRAYAAHRCGGRVAPVPTGVAAEVPIASGAELLGLVVLLGADGAEERALERLRLVAVAALTEIALARDTARPLVDEGAAATLLGALAGGASLSREEVARRAARAGCDLRGGFVAVCCDLRVDRPRHVAALVRDDWPGALAECVQAARLCALLPVRADVSAETLAARLARHGPVGMSPVRTDPAVAGRALEEAALAIDLGTATGPPWAVALADPTAVRRWFEETVAPVLRYDEQYGTELAATLARVLEGEGGVEAVAVQLGLPAHRVAYRLEKIRELSGLDAATAAGRRALALGLRCGRVVARRAG